jgi:raffinose/stachyose/melibiose transport system permease protein
MKWHSRWWQMAIMIVPATIFYLVYLLFPLGLTVYYSLTGYSGLGAANFIGVKNYSRLIDDPIFHTALRDTFIVLGFGLAVLLPMAFTLAVLLSGPIKGSAVLRMLLFAPGIIAPILVGLIWVFILDPKIGLVNAALTAVGIPSHVQWIGGTTLTPYSVGLVYVWEQVGFILTIFYAGLKMVPVEIIEASTIDGATKAQQLRYVTVPMIRQTFSIVTVLIITGSFRVFELVYEMTGGGPVNLSQVLVTYMYNITFGEYEYGYGMAIAVVTAVLGMVISVIFLGVSRARRLKSSLALSGGGELTSGA